MEEVMVVKLRPNKTFILCSYDGDLKQEWAYSRTIIKSAEYELIDSKKTFQES